VCLIDRKDKIMTVEKFMNAKANRLPYCTTDVAITFCLEMLNAKSDQMFKLALTCRDIGLDKLGNDISHFGQSVSEEAAHLAHALKEKDK